MPSKMEGHNFASFCWKIKPKTPPRRPKTPVFDNFSPMLEDFGKFFGGKLPPKTDQKSISTLKTKNQLNTSRLAFSWLYVLEVDLKNPLKID